MLTMSNLRPVGLTLEAVGLILDTDLCIFMTHRSSDLTTRTNTTHTDLIQTHPLFSQPPAAYFTIYNRIHLI